MKVKVIKSFSDLRLNKGKVIKAGSELDVKLDNNETANLTKIAVDSLIKEGFLQEVKAKRKTA